MKPAVTISAGDPRNPGATALLEASHALMQSLFSAEDNHYLSIDALCQHDILFFVAQVNGETKGCAALALRERYGELKSMYVDPAMRGAGIGARLIAHIEDQARAHGRSTLRLETGDTLVAAHRLYHASGFTNCGPFGDYAANETSVFMEKALT